MRFDQKLVEKLNLYAKAGRNSSLLLTQNLRGGATSKFAVE